MSGKVDNFDVIEMIFPKNVVLIRNQDLQKKVLDLYEYDILGGVDILVTDYSSICIVPSLYIYKFDRLERIG